MGGTGRDDKKGRYIRFLFKAFRLSVDL